MPSLPRDGISPLTQYVISTIARWIGWTAVGLAIGIGLGLYIGWFAWPVEYRDANPTVLQDSYRQDYILMIATAYGIDGNLGRAEQRLDELGANGRNLVLDSLLDMIVREAPEAELQQVARLGRDLGLTSPAIERYAGVGP
ncbi:MAG: hypothetical protein AAF614_04000 [Chloroflexota bacterium]